MLLHYKTNINQLYNFYCNNNLAYNFRNKPNVVAVKHYKNSNYESKYT